MYSPLSRGADQLLSRYGVCSVHSSPLLLGRDVCEREANDEGRAVEVTCWQCGFGYAPAVERERMGSTTPAACTQLERTCRPIMTISNNSLRS